MRRTIFCLLLIGSLAILTARVAPDFVKASSAQAPTPKPPEVKIDPKVFDDFVGQYSLDTNPDVVLSFFRENEKYYLQVTNQGRIEIFPASESNFFLKVLDADATFVRDAAGKVSSMVWRQDANKFTTKRISNVPIIELPTPFDRREEMIRMRDGARLHTLIFAPKDQTESLPFIVSRTPYGIGQTSSDGINRRYKELVADGYIFVLQDIRGRYGSEGEFMMIRLVTKVPGASMSTGTTIRSTGWSRMFKNNGRLGFWECVDGWLQWRPSMPSRVRLHRHRRP